MKEILYFPIHRLERDNYRETMIGVSEGMGGSKMRRGRPKRYRSFRLTFLQKGWKTEAADLPKTCTGFAQRIKFVEIDLKLGLQLGSFITVDTFVKFPQIASLDINCGFLSQIVNLETTYIYRRHLE